MKGLLSVGERFLDMADPLSPLLLHQVPGLHAALHTSAPSVPCSREVEQEGYVPMTKVLQRRLVLHGISKTDKMDMEQSNLPEQSPCRTLPGRSDYAQC